MKKIIAAYVQAKFYWNSALGDLNIPLSVFERGALLFLVLDRFEIAPIFTIAGVVILIGITFLWGYVKTRIGVVQAENSLSNRYNPEIQRLLKRHSVKPKKRKL